MSLFMLLAVLVLVFLVPLASSTTTLMHFVQVCTPPPQQQHAIMQSTIKHQPISNKSAFAFAFACMCMCMCESCHAMQCNAIRETRNEKRTVECRPQCLTHARGFIFLFLFLFLLLLLLPSAGRGEHSPHSQTTRSAGNRNVPLVLAHTTGTAWRRAFFVIILACCLLVVDWQVVGWTEDNN